MEMELYPSIFHGNYYSPYNHHHPYYYYQSLLYSIPPPNHVNWTQTPDSHIYKVDLPGVRKEEIRVEVEDGRYLVIRTDIGDDDGREENARRRGFMRKFLMPERVDVEGISAGYEDGVLTVRVPRILVQLRPRVEDVMVDLAAADDAARNSTAPAA